MRELCTMTSASSNALLTRQLRFEINSNRGLMEKSHPVGWLVATFRSNSPEVQISRLDTSMR